MFLTRIRASAAEDADRTPWGNWWFQELGSRAMSGVQVTGDTALGLPTVLACVKVLAESFACMPFVMYRQRATDTGRGTKDRRHWLYRLLAKRPNAYQSPFEWRLMLMGHLALRGNAYCQITANARGEITDLLPLHPARMTVRMLKTGDWVYDYSDANGKTITYLRHEVWHLRGMSGDGIMGYSPIRLAAEAIGEGLSMQAYSARFFGNDAKPGGWIEYPGHFSTSEKKLAFRDSWQQMQGGGNRGKVAVLERGMKFHEVGVSNDDAQFIESRSLKNEDICRIFRVPQHMAGILARSTNNNIEHQGIEFWTGTMLPVAELWEASVETFLLGQDGTDLVEYDTEFDMSRMLRGDTAARTAYYASRMQWSSITPNEVRIAEGDDPLDLPGMDTPIRPVNMVPMGQTVTAPEPTDPGGQDDPAPPAQQPDDAAAANARLHLMVTSASSRLARRAAADVEKRGAAAAFDAKFADMVADTFGVNPQRAQLVCAKFRSAPVLTAENIERGLIACGMGA